MNKPVVPSQKALPKRFSIIKAGPLHEQVAEALRNMIVEGELVEGERIPERQLCELLHVSRTPLREAIKLLASEGLVQLNQNRGAVVARIDTEKLLHSIAVLGVLETAAARLACSAASNQELGAIADIHLQMTRYSARGDEARYFKANQLFHQLIVEASHNPVLIEFHGRLHNSLKRVRYQGMQHDHNSRRGTFIDEHSRIANALTDRNEDEAGDAMQAHMTDVRRMLAGETPLDAQSPSPSP